MDHQGPAGILYNLVKAQLSSSESFAAVETQVHLVAAAAGISDDIVQSVIQRFREELKPEQPLVLPPRLLVDWENFRVSAIRFALNSA